MPKKNVSETDRENFVRSRDGTPFARDQQASMRRDLEEGQAAAALIKAIEVMINRVSSNISDSEKPRPKPGLTLYGCRHLVSGCRRHRLRSLRDEASVRRGNEPLFDFRQPHPLDLPCQAQLLQDPDHVPICVDLVPGESVSG